MSCDHTHRCECKHERVRFCAKCKVVHCLDCKLEWREYPQWSYSYPYYQPYSYPYYQPYYTWTSAQGPQYESGSTIGVGGVGSVTHLTQSGAITTTTCSHGD